MGLNASQIKQVTLTLTFVAGFASALQDIKLRAWSGRCSNIGTTIPICPEAGWWEVIPPRDGLRHNPEYFEAGAIMPKCEINFLRRYDSMTLKFGMRKETMLVDWELKPYPKQGQS